MRDVVYDDFSGGHYVGGSNANQPRTTWTGQNVVCTADEGFLMPDGGWERSDLVAGSLAVDGPFFAPIMWNETTTGLGPRPRAVFAVRPNGGAGSQAYIADIEDSWPAITPGASTTFTGAVRGIVSDVAATSGNQVVFAADRDPIPGTATVRRQILVWNARFPGTPTSVPLNEARNVVQWGEFTVAFTNDSNVIRFSDPSNPTVWPATSFFTVGRPGSLITAVLPAGETLYIGVRGEGWWAVSGVLGKTASLRRIASVGPPGGGAIETQQGLMFAGGGVGQVWLLRGSTTVPFFSAPDEGVGMFGDANTHAVLATSKSGWVWSDVTRRWRRTTTPAGYSHVPFKDMSGSGFLYVLSWTVGVGAKSLYIHRTLREPLQPTVTNGQFNAATVRLAPFTNPTPFRVHEVIAEIDFGRPTNQTPPRSLSCRVETSAAIDIPSAFTSSDGVAQSPTSTTLNRQWSNAQNTVNGHRETIRFAVSDAPTTYSAAPVLTMRGVKIRRVILRYELV
jgi:hypothetical protein